LSRTLHPKQLLPLTGDETMLQVTARRVSQPDSFAPPFVVCNEEHRFLVAEQLREIGVKPLDILLEPEGRNTAPAICVAALAAISHDSDPLLLVLPADHFIGDVARFQAAVQTAIPAAMGGALVTFGAKPERAETGFGYLALGAEVQDAPGCCRLREFVEKPDAARAAEIVATGSHLWNCGIFLFRARRVLEEMRRFEPDILAACERAFAKGRRDIDFFRLDPAAFSACPSRSLDHAVMERTESGVVIPVDMGWSDIGSWSALMEIGDRDDAGNAVVGDVIAHDASNSYLRSEGPLLAAVGVENLIVVAMPDATLVVPRDRAQDVKVLAAELAARGRAEGRQHPLVARPWGSYQTVDAGDRFQVKRLIVNPGARLSSQLHHHRAEHWVVVRGTARITRDTETFLLTENQSTYIPLGTVHRLENPGKFALHLIEVQSGAYLGEDDIVRFEDAYGRPTAGDE
jgi:mannose-1-phosphate guanylyltransferase/mannose-6-phosphate isomerase